jgi:glycosyltransferase involved in cell wall biosynthesis
MRIGIDARELAGRPTGVGRYLTGMLREWSQGAAILTHEFVLYTHAPLDAPDACRVRLLSGAGGTLWEQRDLARATARDGVDVLFSPAYSTPLVTSVPRTVALHDISFEAHPEWFRRRERLRRRTLARRAAAVSRSILTISEFSKGEIVGRFGIPEEKVHVVPPGIDRPAVSAPESAARVGQAVVLYVGSVFNRRHVPDLIRAFAMIAPRHPEASLHIAGDNRSYPHQDLAAIIAAARMAGQVHCYDYAPDERLRALYQSARAFAFLSEYEGLGLTPLEALSAGIPSVLLDTPVARESCGDAALYVPSPDPVYVAPALERLLYDDRTRQAILGAAPLVLARYSWSQAAVDTLRVITDKCA